MPIQKGFHHIVFKGQVFVAAEGGYSHKTEKLFYLGGSNSSRQCIFVASRRRLCNFSLDLSIFKKQNKGFKGRSGYRGLPRFPLCLIRICISTVDRATYYYRLNIFRTPFCLLFFQNIFIQKELATDFLKFSFSEKATKTCAIVIMVLTFTK